MNATTATVHDFSREDGLDVSPPAAKPIDVSRLSLTLPMVAAIVSTAILVSGAQYISQADLRSDIRDIRTRMESQAEVRKLEKELLDAQLTALKADINNATNRAAALSMAQELSKLQNTQRGR